MSGIQERMRELCRPIEQQILMCDDREDINDGMCYVATC